MLRVEDLLVIQQMPRESDLSLELIRQFYKLHLCDRIFILELDDGTEIHFMFEEDNLCHLLGIHHILGSHKFQGQSGYDLIVDGTTTIQFLKRQNKQAYKSKKQRILYFPFVYQMIWNPVLIEYTGQVNTRMDFEIILFNMIDRKYLHLGLRKYKNSHFYYPVSFF